VSAGCFKGIDIIRRLARFEPLPENTEVQLVADTSDELDGEGIEDDRLRLIFTCCHPALPPEAQVALTLREVCGLTTEEIAGAFLVSTLALAQRIVRAKTKIRAARIPYQVPMPEMLPNRVDSVLRVVYPKETGSFSIVSICCELFKENFQAIACRLNCVEVRPVAEDERILKALGFAD
jgi:RNA polymerase sigma-70 factor (ECF subfamily)